ncbi:MAG: hypothetical protein J6V25_09915 [Oscillospiraceae bacterium]|nr:hypothetical protein [Oscillospiraceae bacterium]
MYPYRLPLKFIGLWVLNLAVLLALGIGLGINDFLMHTMNIRNMTYLYLFAGGLLAAAEEWLIDKWKNRNKLD